MIYPNNQKIAYCVHQNEICGIQPLKPRIGCACCSGRLYSLPRLTLHDLLDGADDMSPQDLLVLG